MRLLKPDSLAFNLVWKVCLIQAATPDEAHCIDPLAEGLDLEPFLRVLANTAVTKVFLEIQLKLELLLKNKRTFILTSASEL